MPTTAVTPETRVLRDLVSAHRRDLDALMAKYGATNPRLFGSVARGDAGSASDIDIVVDMDPADGNILFRTAGLVEEVRTTLGRDVDIFPAALLKRPVSERALAEAVAL